MTRLSLSPEPNEWEQGRYRLRDSDSDSSDDELFVSVSHDDCQYSESDDDDENMDYEHPVGFPAKHHPSWGRTRFSLDPTLTPDSIEEQWENQSSLLLPSSSVARVMQSYPPVHTYIDPKTASTASLLRYDGHVERKKRMQHENDREMDQITALLQAASLVDTAKALGPPPVRDPNETPLSMLADTVHDIQQKIAHEKSKMQRDHLRAAQELKQLIHDTQKQADQIRAKEQQIEAAEERAEAKRRQEEAKQKEDDDMRRRDMKAKQDAKNQAILAEQQEAEEEQRKRDAIASKKVEYLRTAEKLVVKLQAVRESIEPFEKSKAVSKRRLNMKKVVRGKVNTLAENAEKIKEVAAEVGQAITVARAEDEDLKKQIANGNTKITPEMPRGKRYLMDLLASSIMTRVQAEGFNGLRGDGFPMANMLALVSLENKELAPILAAHIYTVCPTAIPKLPSPSSDSSEEALMKSLGMVKDKKGEYETFSRFLLRTEGIISLVADIMASNPPQHRLMDGHKGAVDWLERFLGHLPAAPHSPLPLLTAPVLDAFLTGAGHMLANAHADEFRVSLDVIQNDIVNRLDEGPIGQPSATRLKKTVKDGFEGFKNTLPHKALKELYYSADGSDGNVSLPAAPRQQPSSNTFGSSAGTNAASPFGGGGGVGGGTFTSAPNPFGGPASQPSSSAGSNPFGAPSSSSNNAGQGTPNPFGGGSSQAPAFGAPHLPATPFGQQPSGGMGGNNENSMQDESNSNQMSNPFGAKPALGGPSPFGATAPGGGSNTPFGSSSMNSGSNMNNASPFGQPNNAMGSGFGSAPAPSSGGFGQSGFGNSSNNSMGMNASSGGFGSSNPSTNPSPFGSPAPSSFGAPAPSPFGAPSSNSSGGFGASSPFGSGGNNQQQTPFGGGGMGNQQQTPFGGGGMNNQQQSPFGGGGMNNQQQTPFGGGHQQQTPFGGGGGNGGQGQKDNRPPCKFFAKGQCKFGDKCRFSHSGGGGGGGGFRGGGNNAFGRRY